MSTEKETKGSLKIKKSLLKNKEEVKEPIKKTDEQPIKVTALEPEVKGLEKKQEVTRVELKPDVIEEEVITIGETKEEELSVIKDVTDEEEPIKQEAVIESKPEIVLPENIEKLVDFMRETGGSIEDYTRLNADYTKVDSSTLLKEYYKKSKPHLNNEEIDFIMEENFHYDEDTDEQRDIKLKKLAFKEEVAKAHGFLEDLKSKYYDEIKLRPGVTQEQTKAVDFFNRYSEEQKVVSKNHEEFKSKTKQLFSDDFKGFDFKVGEKKFRYGVKNPNEIAKKQSSLKNLVSKFMDDKGAVNNHAGYHKAMYAAENADTIAQHFYEQGRADAVKSVVANSKNIKTEVRETPKGEVYIGGLKVKAVTGQDSSRLKIKTRKFN